MYSVPKDLIDELHRSFLNDDRKGMFYDVAKIAEYLNLKEPIVCAECGEGTDPIDGVLACECVTCGYCINNCTCE